MTPAEILSIVTSLFPFMPRLLGSSTLSADKNSLASDFCYMHLPSLVFIALLSYVFLTHISIVLLYMQLNSNSCQGE